MSETSQPLPSEGGSYIRTGKGELVPAPVHDAPEPAKAPRKPPVKET
jgi:hypothetical protein